MSDLSSSQRKAVSIRKINVILERMSEENVKILHDIIESSTPKIMKEAVDIYNQMIEIPDGEIKQKEDDKG